LIIVLRIVALALIGATFLLNLGWRRRLIYVTLLILLMITGSIVAVSITDRSGSGFDSSPRASSSPTPAPIRGPDVPSFDSACREFRLAIREVDSGVLDEFAERQRKFDGIRANATFPGSPVSFLDLFNCYAIAVNEKLGTEELGTPPTTSDSDVGLQDRAIRRARDDMLSECRTRLG
jgi:hypothetical protein